MNPVFLFKLPGLRRNQWLPPEKLEELQSRKLQKIINYSYNHVKYYKKLFDKVGIKPEDIRSVIDLKKIPVNNRKDFQQQSLHDMVSDKVSLAECKSVTTAGSSGQPHTVFLRQQDFNRFGLTWARASLENGHRLFDRAVYIKFQPPPRFWFEGLGIWKKNVISVLDDNDKKIKDLRTIQPHIIRGNTFELVSLAEYIKKNNIRGINTRRIFSMGSLLEANSRELIETVFQAEVFDFYAATETGCIGWECSKHQGYHLNSDAVVVECIRDGKEVSAGEMGRIICTSLDNFTMPFIRYDLGDIGILDKEYCSCGRGLPLLKTILGRADDFFVTSAGKVVSPSMIVNQVKQVPGIHQFRLTQEKTDLISAILVPAEDYKDQNATDFIKIIRKIMGYEVTVKTELKKDIPRQPGGKIRALVSKLDIE